MARARGFRSGSRVLYLVGAYMIHIYLCTASSKKSRLSNSRLFVCFVDVKRAFPSFRREILLKKYAEDGMNDSLIRVIWAIYKGATATIRGKHGYGRLFEILLGTREGGSEGPLLFVLFI